jgi:hypothetical protein
MSMTADWNMMYHCGSQKFYLRNKSDFDRLARVCYTRLCDLANDLANEIALRTSIYKVVPPTLEECQEEYYEALNTFPKYKKRTTNMLLNPRNDEPCRRSFARHAMENEWYNIMNQNPCV